MVAISAMRYPPKPSPTTQQRGPAILLLPPYLASDFFEPYFICFYATSAKDFICISASPCRNGGNCNPDPRKIMCTCPSGFSGAKCQSPVCASACLNGGSCSVNSQGRPQCTCPTGYSGSKCEVNRCSGMYSR